MGSTGNIGSRNTSKSVEATAMKALPMSRRVFRTQVEKPLAESPMQFTSDIEVSDQTLPIIPSDAVTLEELLCATMRFFYAT